MTSDNKVWAFEEFAKHNKRNDCWLIIAGKVYDVTPYMDDHPGGDEVLLSTTGKDATNDFEDVGHSDYARKTMVKYYIGDIDMSTVPKSRTSAPLQQATNNADKNSESGSILIKLLLPLFFLGLAFATRQFTREQ